MYYALNITLIVYIPTFASVGFILNVLVELVLVKENKFPNYENEENPSTDQVNIIYAPEQSVGQFIVYVTSVVGRVII